MKKIIFSGLLLAAVSSQAMAGGGGLTGGATEYTQMLNNVQLADSYMKQVMQYSTQLQQYQSQLTNMQLNPASVRPGDTQRLISGIGGVMQGGQAIGGTMARIDGNFARTYSSPLAGTYSQNFQTWTTSSQDTLGASMRAAGMHRDAYASDTAALNALYKKTQSSQGTVAAIQTLSEINVSQIEHTQKLEDLIATQNIASSNWMAAQDAKGQAREDASTVRFKATPIPDPKNYKSPTF